MIPFYFYFIFGFLVIIGALLRRSPSNNGTDIKSFVSKRWKPKKSRLGTKATGLNYLVTGGHGAVGSHVVEALLARGEKSITVFDMMDSSIFKDEKSVKVVIGNITDPKKVSEVCKGIDVIFHTAGFVDATKRLSMDWNKFYQVNVLGTKHLLNASMENNVKKFIHTSSASVLEAYHYGAKNADDSSPTAKSPYANHYVHSKVLAEKEVLSVNGKEGLLTGAIRPVGIFGPRDLNIVGQIYKDKPKSLLLIRSTIDMVYIENVVHGQLLLEEKLKEGNDICGEAFIIGNGPTPTLDKLYTKLCQGIGVEVAYAPFRILLGLSYVVEALLWITKGRFPTGDLSKLTPCALHLAAIDNTFSDEKARKLLGYAPIYSLDEGIECCAEFVKGLPGF